MGRASKYILKARIPGETTKWTGWVEVDTAMDLEPLVGKGQEASEKEPKNQLCVFHCGKIVAWWQAGKSLMAQSRAAPPPVVSEEEEGHTYRLFSWVTPQGALVARCVAHDINTAHRMLEQSVLVGREFDGTVIDEGGWDFCLLKPMEGAAVPIRKNFMLHLDNEAAPRWGQRPEWM